MLLPAFRKKPCATAAWASRTFKLFLGTRTACQTHWHCQSIDTALVARYMLGQRRRRWANVKPALIQSIVCNGHVLFPTWVQGFVSGILSLHLFPLQASLYFIVSL